MFEVSFVELAVIALVALLVLGPEKLPNAARVAGLWVRKARASWYSVRAQIERELADDELKRSIKTAGEDLKAIGRELASVEKQVATDVAKLAATASPSDATADAAGNPQDP